MPGKDRTKNETPKTPLGKMRALSARARRVLGGGRKRPKQIFMHIGPHRTGTTTIQHTLRQSADVLPKRYGALTRANAGQLALSQIIHRAKSAEALRKKSDVLKAAAEQVAASFDSEIMIISDEDLLGALPSRRGMRGLYPLMEIAFPIILDAFRETGAEVKVVWTRRKFGDWLESVYRRRYLKTPERQFRPRVYRNDSGIPARWGILARRLETVCGPENVAMVSFENDVKSGIMGNGLFRLAGMTDDEIASLNHSRPRGVSPFKSGRGNERSQDLNEDNGTKSGDVTGP